MYSKWILLINLLLLLVSCNHSKKEKDKARFIVENLPYSIQVLNGVGKPGLGKAVRNDLISRGFNIMDYRNARHFIYNKTVIIIRSEDNKIDVNKLKNALGIKKIYYQIKENSDYDLQIIVGRDYRDIFPSINSQMGQLSEKNNSKERW
ncbi:MAG: hypothetical protein DRH57_02870 [Candidatus Cloacimonadota bacterium]|nr:MAG: hypothetical protein DRH57_02870 [Candidatus Cloacimonadota bacterium]